jgi:hypothetical protein
LNNAGVRTEAGVSAGTNRTRLSISGGILHSDITGSVALVQSCFENITAAYRKVQIQQILASADWHEHHRDSKTGRRVLSHAKELEHPHEKTTAVLLTQVNYDVIFVPKAMFKHSEKRYDVLLLRDTVILKADLKCIFSKNPNTIANASGKAAIRPQG